MNLCSNSPYRQHLCCTMITLLWVLLFCPLASNAAPLQELISSFNFMDWRFTQTPYALSEAGFECARDGDRVKCVHCHYGLEQWNPSDNPTYEHLKWITGQDHSCPTLLSTISHPEPYTPSQLKASVRANSFLINGISCQNKDNLAAAGLFYLGPGDKAQCFYCQGGLKNWRPGDNPLREHIKYFPNCPFVANIATASEIEIIQKVENPYNRCLTDKSSNYTAPFHPELYKRRKSNLDQRITSLRYQATDLNPDQLKSIALSGFLLKDNSVACDHCNATGNLDSIYEAGSWAAHKATSNTCSFIQTNHKNLFDLRQTFLLGNTDNNAPPAIEQARTILTDLGYRTEDIEQTENFLLSGQLLQTSEIIAARLLDILKESLPYNNNIIQQLIIEKYAEVDIWAAVNKMLANGTNSLSLHDVRAETEKIKCARTVRPAGEPNQPTEEHFLRENMYGQNGWESPAQGGAASPLGFMSTLDPNGHTTQHVNRITINGQRVFFWGHNRDGSTITTNGQPVVFLNNNEITRQAPTRSQHPSSQYPSFQAQRTAIERAPLLPATGDGDCSICLVQKANILSTPCGHLATCRKCALNDRLGTQCPICRERILNRVPAFFN